MSLQTPAYLPVMWVGGYSLPIGPTKLSFDRETNVAEKVIPSALEHTEPIGYTGKKLTIEGFLAGPTSTVAGTPAQPIVDLWQWLASSQTPGSAAVSGSGDGFFDRPISVGFFTSDPLTFDLWYSDVCYITSFHTEYGGGYAQHKFDYRLQTIQANPVQYLATTTTINSSNVTYQFNMSGNDIASNPLQSTNGYIAGYSSSGRRSRPPATSPSAATTTTTPRPFWAPCLPWVRRPTSSSSRRPRSSLAAPLRGAPSRLRRSRSLRSRTTATSR